MLREHSPVGTGEASPPVPHVVYVPGETSSASADPPSSSAAPTSAGVTFAAPRPGSLHPAAAALTNANGAAGRRGPGTLASRLRSATVVSGPPRPDAFMTVVHSARVMNTATNEGTALSKAAFYDQMLKGIDSGLDEQLALAEGVKAAREADEQRKRRIAAVADDAQLEQTPSTPVPAPPPALPAAPAPLQPTATLASLPVPPSTAVIPTPALPHSGPTDSLDDVAAAASSGRSKLKGIFTKIIKPTISFHGDDALIDSNAAGGMGTSMQHLRVLHRKLCMTVEDYDAITVSKANDRERSIIQSSKSTVQKAVDDARKAVTAEYEPRIKHDKCNARISILERENKIMMDETGRTMALNKELTAQITTLRLSTSTAESERVLMVQELARRRLQTRAMREKLRAAQKRLAELEAVNAVDAEDLEGIDTNDEDEAMQGNEGSGDEDAEWQEWCRGKTFTQPLWNPSTASKMLSQPAPESVIHIGDGAADDLDELDARGRRRRAQPDTPQRPFSNKPSRIGSAASRNRQQTIYGTTVIDLPPSTLPSHQYTEPEDAPSAVRGLLAELKRNTRPISRSRSRSSSISFSACSSSSSSDEEEETAATPARPHHRPSSAPMTGAGAGIPRDEVGKQPTDFARPAIDAGKVQSSAARAARAVGMNVGTATPPTPPQLPQPQQQAQTSTRPAPVPPPSHNARAAAFSVAKWVERASSNRPRSAPDSRFGVPLDPKAQPPPPPPPPSSHPKLHKQNSKNNNSSTSLKPVAPLEIATARHVPKPPRPVSAPSGTRAGGLAGVLVGRACPRPTYEQKQQTGLLGIAVSGRHILL
ncbi:hypothetical protein DFJ77DRAFT_507061 [Powellomyces hirtus]|nr:hypothetical protein DFJ77DRAFT_507061 [Powellomyces hirtus]